MGEKGSEIEILIGGKAGEGINRAGQVIAEILSEMGYYIFMIFDHPSLIKGGHNYSIIRASEHPVGGIKRKPDIVLALDKNTIKLHEAELSPHTVVIFNSDKVKNAEGIGIPAVSIVDSAGGVPIMINSCLIGAFCKTAGLEWSDVEQILLDKFPVRSALNLDIARKGYDISEVKFQLIRAGENRAKLITGSESLGLGLCYGGIEGYIAYPMSPASGILHFLSSKKDEFNLKVFQPEGEIAAILMAEGMACCGCRAAVGTSGGGFCLMNEGISYSGLAEIPIVIINSQRQSPSTGAPTYTAQSDLPYAISAGHGEFPRIVISPGNAEQAFMWSAKAPGLAWKYQVPVIILTDVTLNDSLYSLSPETVINEDYDYGYKEVDEGPYLRYRFTGDGISPLGFFNGNSGPVKINGKTHDESGISTENPRILEKLAEKRIRKASIIKRDMEGEKCVLRSGNSNSGTTVVSWGSNGPLCSELCSRLKIRSVQPIVLHPFPEKQFETAISESSKIIVVEDNSTGQLSELMKSYGFFSDNRILNYSGRQISLETLEKRLMEVI
ncbi:MAG: 2-oxoacid:acceptor oxidoreductase family protein [Methanomicrobiaceae archaeon]|nr:2-oxoacid:acceptor oxidoreductase family protein [Methanomicrobiaceae archaeon]